MPQTAPIAADRATALTRTGLALRCLVVAALMVVASGGCASSKAAFGDGDESGDSARQAYFEAMQELVDGNFAPAIALFNQVARSPRYVRYAALAKLRVGDALFFQDRFQEAAEAYRGFLGQYKSDPNTPYARFRVAQSYYERIPSEWFATPPAHEMDQTLTRQAEAELLGFLGTFPTSRFAAEARVMLTETRQMLFEHELFAANFYAEKSRWRAVAWRLDRAVQSYPDLALKPALVWRMANAYAKAEDSGQAARTYGLYLEKFPEGPHRVEAKKALEAIRASLDTSSNASPDASPPSTRR